MLNLDDLNEQQYKAVTAGIQAPLLVLAGPGSGKTFTLTKRILYLVLEHRIPPEQILVLTFTKAAAVEMQKRFQTASQKFHISLSPVFGTFHSVFYHILIQSKIIIPNQFINEKDKIKILREILLKLWKERGISNLNVRNKELIYIAQAISYYQNTLDINEACEKLADEYKQDFVTLYERYSAYCEQSGKYSFDDILTKLLKTLQTNQKLLSYWRNRFPFLLIDEFQDINPVQYSVVKLLGAHLPVFAVGDDDQAIYGFRGAKPGCLKQFTEEFGASVITLELNYRSLPKIVNASLEMIGENKLRITKNLRSAYNDELNGEAFLIKSFQKKEEQFEYIAQEILASKRRGETSAILFRTNSSMLKMAYYLKTSNIDFEMKEEKHSAEEEMVIRDVEAFFRLCDEGINKKDLQIMLTRFVPHLSKEILLTSLDSVINGKIPDCNTYGYLERLEIVDELKKWKEFIRRGQCFSGYLRFQFFLKCVGYERIPQFTKNTEEKQELYQLILNCIGGMLKENDCISTVRKALTDSDNGCTEKIPETTTLYTIHGSKGLEFDKVIIPDCNEHNYPHGEIQNENMLEEERRLFYVAMTRAKKNLELLFVKGTDDSPRQASIFLNPFLKSFHQIRNYQGIHQKHQLPFHIPRHLQ